jgi:hypothetical protein
MPDQDLEIMNPNLTVFVNYNLSMDDATIAQRIGSRYREKKDPHDHIDIGTGIEKMSIFDGKPFEPIDLCACVSRIAREVTFAYVMSIRDKARERERTTNIEVLAAMKRAELRPAFAEEMVAFLEAYPRELKQRCRTAVALGSTTRHVQPHPWRKSDPDQRCVLCLHENTDYPGIGFEDEDLPYGHPWELHLLEQGACWFTPYYAPTIFLAVRPFNSND